MTRCPKEGMDARSVDTKKNKGHWQEFADASGIDAKYAEQQARADKELADATAGPDDSVSVPPDDTDMKNPHGEFQGPSAMKMGSGPAPGK